MARFIELLKEWQLEEYIPSFEDQGIDDKSFTLIDEETINKVFLKAGPKLVFKKKFNEYKQVLENIIIVENIVDNCGSPTSTPSGSSYIDSEPETPNLTLLDTIDELLLPTSSSWASPVSKRLESPYECNPKKNRTSIFSQGIVKLLQENKTDGSIILSNKLKLNNDHRQKLCKVLIAELIKQQGTEIRGSTFLKISEEILDIFPNKNGETYYVPYITGGIHNKGTGPKGKLWSRYVNVKAALRLANSHRKVTEPEKAVSPIKENESCSLEFLKVGTEPLPKVLEAWENTFKLRKKLYINSSISAILTEFPCLRLNYGIELIESDFNQKFPEKIDTLYLQWPKVCSCLIKEGDERSIRQNHSIKDKNVTALLLLPYLFSPTTLKKSRKGISWRPTRSEIQESFIFHVRNFDDLESRIETRRKKLQEFNITFQPLGAIVGDLDSSETLEYYIIVEDVMYKCDTPLRQLELLYKVFHALDIEYPSECEHIWIFIQEMVFLTKSNKKCPSTSTLMADINYHINATNQEIC